MNYLVHNSDGVKITDPFYINNAVSYELTFVQIIQRNISSSYSQKFIRFI